MDQAPLDDERLKRLFKTALIEVLEERKSILRDIIEKTLEDIALARAIEHRQGTGDAQDNQRVATVGR